VVEAIKTGYRLKIPLLLIRMKKPLAGVLKKIGIDRKELFITIKLWVQDAGYESAKAAFAKSLKKLHLDYPDLDLITSLLAIFTVHGKQWKNYIGKVRSGPLV
jgi:2,5-diketo-D-gluconate reductase A